MDSRRTSLDDFIETIQATFHDNLSYFQQDTVDFGVPQLDGQPLDLTLLPRSLSFEASTVPPLPPAASAIPFQHDSDSDDSSSESEVEEAILPKVNEREDNVQVVSYTNLNDVRDNTPFIADDFAYTAQYVEPILPAPKVYRGEEETQIPSRVQTPTLPSRAPTPILPPYHDSDADAEGETDDPGSDDDEYIPPSSGSRITKRRTRAPSPTLHSPPSPRYAPYTPPSKQKPKRQRASPPSRNVQVATPIVVPEGQYTCPYCGWEQANKRAPDFARHLRTHTRPSNSDHSVGWWCKGVDVSLAKDYGISPNAKPYVFRGQLRVGGCLKTFSRRDALKRHLDNKNVRCIGHPTAPHED